MSIGAGSTTFVNGVSCSFRCFSFGSWNAEVIKLPTTLNFVLKENLISILAEYQDRTPDEKNNPDDDDGYAGRLHEYLLFGLFA